MPYKDLLPIGTGLVIVSASFGLGAIYLNLPYDYETLFSKTADASAFDDSFNHYLKWAKAPAKVHHVLHFFMGLGLLGSIIKIYKPSEDSKYFEYGSMGLLFGSIVIYLTNLRTGINSCFYNNFGEISRDMGINVMAASQFMAVVLLVGVILLQGGLYYAEWYDNQLKLEFFEKNPEYTEVNGMAVKKEDLKEVTGTSDAATTTGAEVEEEPKDKKKRKSKKN